MTRVLAVVPSGGIRTNPQGEVNFRFLFEAQVDPSFYHYPYGFIMRTGKSSEYISPFKLVRGEDGAFGDDGVVLWQVWVGTSEGVSYGGHQEATCPLSELLEGMPDCVVMVSPSDFDEVRQALETLGIELIVHNYEGQLALAG